VLELSETELYLVRDAVEMIDPDTPAGAAIREAVLVKVREALHPFIVERMNRIGEETEG
jgi:hypothetical protein